MARHRGPRRHDAGVTAHDLRARRPARPRPDPCGTCRPRGRSSCATTRSAGCSTATSRPGSPSTSWSRRTTSGEVVACAYSIPFVLGDDDLPDNGWDCVVRNGLLASLRGEQPDAISAVEIAVRPDRQGTGLSGQMLVAMRDNAARHGVSRARRARAAQRQDRPARADVVVRLPRSRRRPAGRPVAPRPRAGGRPDRRRWRRARWHPGHPRRVAGVDGTAVRRDRSGRRARRRWPRCTATSSTASRRTSSPTSGSCTRPASEVRTSPAQEPADPGQPLPRVVGVAGAVCSDCAIASSPIWIPLPSARTGTWMIRARPW